MKKILVIEDDKSIREAISEILSLNDFNVLTAKDGKEGVFKAFEEIPDAIISDIMMPEMDGYEVLKNIRNNKQTENVPFILLTAKVERTDQRMGMNLGADDYITKPFTAKELIGTLNTRLERAEKIKTRVETKVKQLIKEMNDVSVHEFNTPLNGLIGSIDFISKKMDKENDNSYKELLSVMKTSGLRLKRMVDNIYIYKQLTASENMNTSSQFEGGLCSIELEVIESRIIQIEERYQRKGDIEANVQTALLNIKSDVLMIIIEELLDNALKFSEKGTKVNIEGKKINGKYEIKITDNGFGFDPKDTGQIDAFVQFERKKLAQQGSGLGLFITSKILALNNGTLNIQSSGRGSTVTAILPIGNVNLKQTN